MTESEVDIILQDILEYHGYDFTAYTKASIKRRLERLYILDRFSSFRDFNYKIKSDPQYFQRFIEEVTVTVTEMFRDTHFFKELRNNIIPMLASHPHIRIWHAGCSTGEEVLSLAIILKELNLLHKAIIYATDINPKVLENIRSGVFSLSNMKQYSENYIRSGGQGEFSTYYTASYDKVIFSEELKSKIIFSIHNLATDSSFNEFNLILCRNVLIYFNKELQDRALDLFDKSLAPLGYLCLGSKENLKYSVIGNKYEQFHKEKIWKKIL